GLFRTRRATEQDQAGAAGDARARAVRPRQRHRAPLPFQLRRLAAAELADVPGPGQVERVGATEEFVPDVGDLGLGDLRRPALLEHVGVERQRAAEAGAGEVAAGVVVAQQRVVL